MDASIMRSLTAVVDSWVSKVATTTTVICLGTASAYGQSTSNSQVSVVRAGWDNVPRLPLGHVVEKAIEAITSRYGAEISAVTDGISGVYETMQATLLSLPALAVGGVLVIAIWKTAGRGPGIFAIAALLLINSIDLWPQTMSTFALMGTAVAITLLIGIPVGVLASNSEKFEAAITPLLDLMQTMPPFVYLIPAVIMFGIGPVPSIFATVFYALPVPIRLTNVGIRQVDRRVIEAGEAFGCSSRQLLFKIKLPIALPVIAAGINQTVMYSLGMVIVASMIGAGGLGAEILRGVSRLQLGVGFEGGIAVVMVAVLLDQLGRGVVRMLGGPHRSKAGRGK